MKPLRRAPLPHPTVWLSTYRWGRQDLGFYVLGKRSHYPQSRGTREKVCEEAFGLGST